MFKYFVFFFILSYCVNAQSKVYVHGNKEYKHDESKDGQEASKNIDTSVDYQLDDLYNLDLTPAERAQAKAIIDVYTKQIKDNPKDIGAYTNRGAYWAQLGLHVQAINDYNQALKIDPDQPIIYYNRALSKARFFYTYDACLDLKKSSHLGLLQADKLLNTKCGKHLEQLSKEKL